VICSYCSTAIDEDKGEYEVKLFLRWRAKEWFAGKTGIPHEAFLLPSEPLYLCTMNSADQGCYILIDTAFTATLEGREYLPIGLYKKTRWLMFS